VTYFDGAAIQADNVGKLDGWGFEGSISQGLGEYLELNSGIAWFDSEANDLQKICDGTDECEGQSIPWAPEWSGHVALIGNYAIAEGELFGMMAYHFQTKQEAGWEPDSFSVDGYGELNLSVGYRLGHYAVTAYVDNATDEDYYDGGGNGDSVFSAFEFGPSRPRTVGMKLTVDFD
jgi:iron complex outermembrane receptor protein